MVWFLTAKESSVRRDPNDGPDEDVVGWKHSGVRPKWKHEVLGKLVWSGSDGQILIFVYFSGSVSLCADMDSRMLLTWTRGCCWPGDPEGQSWHKKWSWLRVHKKYITFHIKSWLSYFIKLGSKNHIFPKWPHQNTSFPWI